MTNLWTHQVIVLEMPTHIKMLKRVSLKTTIQSS